MWNHNQCYIEDMTDQWTKCVCAHSPIRVVLALSASKCAYMDSCSECRQRDGCGWCQSTGRCIEGNADGGFFQEAGCTEYFFQRCRHHP